MRIIWSYNYFFFIDVLLQQICLVMIPIDLVFFFWLKISSLCWKEHCFLELQFVDCNKLNKPWFMMLIVAFDTI